LALDPRHRTSSSLCAWDSAARSAAPTSLTDRTESADAHIGRPQNRCVLS
jgi:hypothetical protein